MNSPASQTASAQAGNPAASSAPGLPDGPRVQEQLAALTESGELRPLLEFLRALLNARALAIFPGSENAGAASVVVTTRGILATALAPIGERLANTSTAVVEAAPSLGEEGYTLAVPVRRDEHPLWVLIAQLVVPNARDLQAFLVILQTVAGYLLYREQRLVTADIHWVLARTSGLLDIFRRAGMEEDFEKAARIDGPLPVRRSEDEHGHYELADPHFIATVKLGEASDLADGELARVKFRSPVSVTLFAEMRATVARWAKNYGA